MANNLTILVDADVLAYSAASAAEVATEFEPGYWTWYCDENAVKDTIESAIGEIKAHFGTSSVALALTDTDGNFRKSILPSYKGNRSGVKKPLVLKSIKEWMISELGAYWKPGLEGDDILGILATHPTLIKGEKIILSVDKDMKTIPGKFTKDIGEPIIEVTPDEADYWHLFQTLTGDSTDGYSGCPKVGPVKATAILSNPTRTLWAEVVKAYAKQGLTESDALVQARVARILRASDYDFATKQPILWSPK